MCRVYAIMMSINKKYIQMYIIHAKIRGEVTTSSSSALYSTQIPDLVRGIQRLGYKTSFATVVNPQSQGRGGEGSEADNVDLVWEEDSFHLLTFYI